MNKKYSDFSSGTVSSDKILLLGDPSTGALEKVTAGDMSTLPVGTKIYLALMNQTGTNAPVATVGYNSLGGTVVWARDDDSNHLGVLAGAFTAGKTFVLCGQANNSIQGIGVGNPDADTINLTTPQGDGTMQNLSLLVIVIP